MVLLLTHQRLVHLTNPGVADRFSERGIKRAQMARAFARGVRGQTFELLKWLQMLKISKKIELATNFNVTTRHGASSYQTTNYGLAGKYESV